MNAEPQSRVIEQNVLTSIRRHLFLIAAVVALYAGVSAVVASQRPLEYVGEAEMVLQDPQSTPLAEVRSGRDESRYVDSQIAFLRSSAVAERASVVARTTDERKTIDPRTLQRKTTIEALPDSNYVVVRFRARDRETAAAGANAIVGAYRSLVRADFEADTAAALGRLDVAIDEADRAISDESGTPEEFAAGAALLEELSLQRARFLVNAKLGGGDGVALFSPAKLGSPRGTPWLAALAVGLVLGGLTGVGLAYWLDARTQTFSGRLEPLGLVGAPALAEIPDFRREGIASTLPVRDAPGTDSSEAFRFLASGVGLSPEPGHSARLAATRVHANGRVVVDRSVAFVSASPGDGATTIAANTALAAAQQGSRVLVIDADLGARDMARLLLGRDAPTGGGSGVAGADLGDMLRQGVPAATIRQAMDTAVGETPSLLAEMLRDGASADGVRQVMRTGAGGTLSLLGPVVPTGRRSRQSRSPGGATVEERIPEALNAIRDQFDLVVIDVPPILQASYADTLLRSAGALVIVVPHRGDVGRLKNVLDRLDLLGIQPSGYVYNRAPAPQRRWPLHDPGRAVAGRAKAKAKAEAEVA